MNQAHLIYRDEEESVPASWAVGRRANGAWIAWRDTDPKFCFVATTSEEACRKAQAALDYVATEPVQTALRKMKKRRT